MSGRLYSDTIIARQSPLTVQESVGIMLWGPPGCGKSSSAQRLMDQYSPMYFINTDAIVECLIHNYFHAKFKEIKRKDNTSEKQAFYWKMRNCTFDEICHGDSDVTFGAIIDTVFNDVFRGVGENPTNIEIRRFSIYNFRNTHDFGRELDPSQFYHEKSMESKVTDFTSNLAIFLAKTRGCHFMIETTGGSFDREWAASTFNVHNILQIVYVSSPDTLIDRVSRRHGQWINAEPDRIRTTYNLSYIDSFPAAVQSEIFDEIIIDVNDHTPLRVVHLEKPLYRESKLGKRESQRSTPYTIAQKLKEETRDRLPTENEHNFIARLFEHSGLPNEFLELGKRIKKTAIKFQPEFPYTEEQHETNWRLEPDRAEIERIRQHIEHLDAISRNSNAPQITRNEPLQNKRLLEQILYNFNEFYASLNNL
jgi:hypothetical protein